MRHSETLRRTHSHPSTRDQKRVTCTHTLQNPIDCAILAPCLRALFSLSFWAHTTPPKLLLPITSPRQSFLCVWILQPSLRYIHSLCVALGYSFFRMTTQTVRAIFRSQYSYCLCLRCGHKWRFNIELEDLGMYVLSCLQIDELAWKFRVSLAGRLVLGTWHGKYQQNKTASLERGINTSCLLRHVTFRGCLPPSPPAIWCLEGFSWVQTSDRSFEPALRNLSNCQTRPKLLMSTSYRQGENSVTKVTPLVGGMHKSVTYSQEHHVIALKHVWHIRLGMATHRNMQKVTSELYIPQFFPRWRQVDTFRKQHAVRVEPFTLLNFRVFCTCSVVEAPAFLRNTTSIERADEIMC